MKHYETHLETMKHTGRCDDALVDTLAEVRPRHLAYVWPMKRPAHLTRIDTT